MSHSAPHFPEPLEDSCRVTSDRIVGAGLSVGQSWRVHTHQTKLNRTILRVGGWGWGHNDAAVALLTQRQSMEMKFAQHVHIAELL